MEHSWAATVAGEAPLSYHFIFPFLFFIFFHKRQQYIPVIAAFKQGEIVEVEWFFFGGIALQDDQAVRRYQLRVIVQRVDGFLIQAFILRWTGEDDIEFFRVSFDEAKDVALYDMGTIA